MAVVLRETGNKTSKKYQTNAAGRENSGEEQGMGREGSGEHITAGLGQPLGKGDISAASAPGTKLVITGLVRAFGAWLCPRLWAVGKE